MNNKTLRRVYNQTIDLINEINKYIVSNSVGSYAFNTTMNHIKHNLDLLKKYNWNTERLELIKEFNNRYNLEMEVK